ncbi:MliC family protein [Gymnodinialimonas hymeniacidonis]|uniref:MliC family protein n=1 Tax=Gymnodinialimonas hymeniacidonis TaxID=3126508 RepID=UPI0034C69718
MKYKTAFVVLAMTAGVPSVSFANVSYACGALNGIEFTATYFDEEDVVGVDARNQSNGQVTRAVLNPAVSGSGSRFFDPSTGLDFVEHQGQAFLTTASGAQFNCVVTSIDEPGGSQAGGGYDPQVGPFPGFSFGGNLRGGPGTNFADVGSTFEGQPITLVTDTGIFFNGYSWWAVQLQNGQDAYQWGGLLCAPGLQLAGIFNEGC